MTALSPFITAGWAELASALLAGWLLHEGGHLLMLRLLGLSGGLKGRGWLGVAVMTDAACQGWREAVTAAAGPLVNLLMCRLCLWLGWQAGAQVNFVLAVVNLLPILPLDGGKILRGLSGGLFGWLAVSRALLFGARSAALCLVLCVAYFGLSRWLLLGAGWLYLLALREEENLSYLHMAALTATVGQSLRPRRVIYQRRDVPIYRAVRRFSPGRRNWLIYDGRLIEGDWLLGRLRQGQGAAYVSQVLMRSGDKTESKNSKIKKEKRNPLPNKI